MKISTLLCRSLWKLWRLKNGTHTEIGSFEKKCTEGWDYKTKGEATSLLNAVTVF